MRVLVLGLGSIKGGVEKFFLDRLPYLPTEYTIDFGFTNIDSVSYATELEAYNCKLVEIPHFRNPFTFYTKIKNLILGRYDIVYCNVAFSHYVLFQAIKDGRAKLIVHAHNTNILFKNKCKEELFKAYHYVSKLLVTNLIDSSYTCSQDAAKWVFYETDAVKLRKNTIQIDQYKIDESVRKSYRLQLNVENKQVLACIGRLSEQKNQKFLLQIFNEYLKTHRNSVLLLIGEGEDKESLINTIKHLGLESEVKLLGYRKDIVHLLQAIDCLVMPSKSEGFAIVLLEAQALQVGCVISDKVPKEVMLHTNMEQVGLQEDIKVWCDAIDRVVDYNRYAISNQLENKGYNLSKDKADYIDFFE